MCVGHVQMGVVNASLSPYLPCVQRPQQLGEHGLADDGVDGAVEAAASQLRLHQEVPVTHAVRWQRHRASLRNHCDVVVERAFQ